MNKLDEKTETALEPNWLAGKHLLITGGSDGIGLAVAKMVGHDCKTLTLLSYDEEQLKLAAKKLTSEFQVAARVSTIVSDINDKDKTAEIVKSIYEKGDQVDCFFNCAGGTHFYGMLEEMSHQDISTIFRTNAEAPLHWLKELLPRMKNNRLLKGENKRAQVVLMSSRSAERPLPNLSVYAAAKASLEAMTEALRREYARHRIAFTLINPGSIKTAFTAKWSKSLQDSHNDESMSVEEAIDPIVRAMQADHAVNKISFESMAQWENELGVLRGS